MMLPEAGEWLEEITYAELPEAEAKTLVAKYNKEGRDAGFGYHPRGGSRDYRGKWHPMARRM